MSEARPTLLLADEFTGQSLGRYELVCRLATGGMADIYLGLLQGAAGFRKLVVLKKVRPGLASDEHFVEMLRDEARTTAGFTHPNIAQVFDLDRAGDELFLTMEFVSGATLVDLIAASGKAPMPLGLSLAVARDVALALHYAHTYTDLLGNPQPVVHRDVSAKNVMLSFGGVTKLLDFGIAKSRVRAARTAVGTIKGTPGYMSPEQVRGEPLDGRSDVFSLGAMLHECLTGAPLFDRADPDDAVMAPLRVTAPAPSRLRPEVPPELDALVLKALAREPAGRFATAQRLARALEEIPGATLWSTDERAAYVQRHFSSRRQQAEQLVAWLKPITDAALDPPTGRGWARLSASPSTGTRELPSTKGREPGADPGPEARTVRSGPRKSKRLLVLASSALLAALLAARLLTKVEPAGVAPPQPRADATSQPTPPTLPSAEPTEAALRDEEGLEREPSLPPDGPAPEPAALRPEQQKAPPARGPTRGTSWGPPPPAPQRSGATTRFAPAPASVRQGRVRFGKLSLDTEPSARVFFEQQDLGQTPLSEASLPPGTHRLRLLTSEGREFRLDVEVTEGHTTAMRVSLASLSSK